MHDACTAWRKKRRQVPDTAVKETSASSAKLSRQTKKKTDVLQVPLLNDFFLTVRFHLTHSDARRSSLTGSLLKSPGPRTWQPHRQQQLQSAVLSANTRALK